jgi:hypothetical protein
MLLPFASVLAFFTKATRLTSVVMIVRVHPDPDDETYSHRD